MEDLSLDELANCPAPEDALLLLSPDAAEAMQAVSEPVRLEVCKTIVALGDVVARTHAPLLAAIKLTLREGGGIQTTAEANGRVFYRRGDVGLVSAFSGGICAIARAESKQRTGSAHAEALSTWGLALVEAGQYLAEMATTSRSIGDEIANEREGLVPGFKGWVSPHRVSPEDVGHSMCEADGNCKYQAGHDGLCSTYLSNPGTDAPPIHPRISPTRMPGRGGVPMCTIDDKCVHEKGHGGPCCDRYYQHEGPCSTAPTAHANSRKCGRFSTPERPDGCIRPKDHEGGCSGVVA